MIQKSSLIQRTSTSSFNIDAPGSGRYICLTSLDVESDGATLVVIESAVGNTIWQHGITADESIFKSWEEEIPLRGAENAIMRIAVLGGNLTVNIRGFVTP